VVLKSVRPGEAIHCGADPGPWLARMLPEAPAPLLTDRAPPLTTKFDEIVTAWLAAPRLAALLTVIEEL